MKTTPNQRPSLFPPPLFPPVKTQTLASPLSLTRASTTKTSLSSPSDPRTLFPNWSLSLFRLLPLISWESENPRIWNFSLLLAGANLVLGGATLGSAVFLECLAVLWTPLSGKSYSPLFLVWFCLVPCDGHGAELPLEMLIFERVEYFWWRVWPSPLSLTVLVKSLVEVIRT